MNYVCSELMGALYQPKSIIGIDNCWVIPAYKDGAAVHSTDCKLIFTYQENMGKREGALTEYHFVNCYQFIFCHLSHVYWYYSLRYLNNIKPFVLTGIDINDIEKQVRNKYGQLNTNILKDFTNLENEYCTRLPNVINFLEFYKKFNNLYIKNAQFKEIIMLFCDTNNGLTPIYNNILQKIAQLQTIFETLIGVPKTLKCGNCGMSHYIENWNTFLDGRLKDYGITEPDDIQMITKIKGALNEIARVKYVHASKYFDPSSPYIIIKDIKKNEQSDNNPSIKQIMEMNPSSWSSINWLNIYDFYLVLVRNLIYLKYLKI